MTSTLARITLLVLPLFLSACTLFEHGPKENVGIWTGHEVEDSESLWTFIIRDDRIESIGQNPMDWFKGTLTLHPGRGDIKTAEIHIDECGVSACVGMTCHVIYKRHRNRLDLAMSIPGAVDKPRHFFPASSTRVFVLFKEE